MGERHDRSPRTPLQLASQSPRRAQILTEASIPFVVVAPGVEPDGAGPPIERALQRARTKAIGAAADPARLVLGVDTVVESNGATVEPARDRDEAERTLLSLAGRVHLVHTALALVADGEVLHAVATAAVGCARPDPAALRRYLDSNDWRGKAGAYGIQDPGCDFMTLVAGDRDTVVGLPLRVLRDLLTAVDA
jgi:MAF protein